MRRNPQEITAMSSKVTQLCVCMNVVGGWVDVRRMGLDLCVPVE